MALPRAIALLHLIVLAAACTRAPEPAPARTRNLLLVTIDTLRADRVGKGLTPTLDGLAARGVRFDHARSNVPLTLPAHTSIMTGLLPPAHGARVNGVPATGVRQPLAVRLRQAGYRTGAVVGAFVLDRRFGLAEGFETYDDRVARDPDALDQLQAERPASAVIDAALHWLHGADAERPWLLWVHLYDPHAPYADSYDQDVARADGELRRLVAAVTARADAAHTAIVAAGDHGESLGEHGEATHGMLVFEAALRVPLIITATALPPSVRADAASLIDILPTALALTGQPQDATLPGRNLLGPADRERETYAETEYPAVAGWRPARVLVQDRWKLIGSARSMLFDLQSDPGEHADLAASRAALAQAMQARLAELARTSTAATPATATSVDPETAARLRALGYVAPTSARPAAGTGVDAADAIADWVVFEQALSQRDARATRDPVQAFETVARKHPDGPIFQSTYARALMEAGRAREALAIYRRAVARWPGDATLYHELAVAAREAGDATEARRAEQAALAISPEFAAARNGLGLLAADAGNHAEAAISFERASLADPTNASYLANLGNARRALGQLEGAAAAYRQALDRDATFADAANGLGVVLVQQKRAAEAVPFFERAVARDPAFAEAHLNLGIALQESGQPARALTQYRRVEEMPKAHTRERDAARALRQGLERR